MDVSVDVDDDNSDVVVIHRGDVHKIAILTSSLPFMRKT